MIDKTTMEKLHEINSMVIKLTKKNYIYQSDVDTESINKFHYDVKINSDGSIGLCFQPHIINDKTVKTYVRCTSDKDLEDIKRILQKRIIY